MIWLGHDQISSKYTWFIYREENNCCYVFGWNLFKLLLNFFCLAPAQQDLLTTLYVQSDRTGEGEMFTEEEISMLWKRSSDCLERSVIVSFRWLVSHPYCGYTHLKHDTSRGRLVHRLMLMICSIRLIGGYIALYFLCVNFYHDITFFDPRHRSQKQHKAAEYASIFCILSPFQVEKIARFIALTVSCPALWEVLLLWQLEVL